MTIIVNQGSLTPDAPATLVCNYVSLVNDVGFHLYGLRPTSSDVIADAVASASQASDILRCIAKGLQFVYSAHRWSFLRPLVPITTAVGVDNYALPDGVDGLEGQLTYPKGSDRPPEELDKVAEVEIRRMLARNNMPGRPRLYAETTSTFDPRDGSSRFVALYPTPDGVYVLTAIGTLRPQMIDPLNQYPVGIEVLAPCLTESCLAAAERDFDQNPSGVHAQSLAPLLAMAIQRDKEHSSPDTLGVDHGGDDGAEHCQHRRTGTIHWDAGGGFTGFI